VYNCRRSLIKFVPDIFSVRINSQIFSIRTYASDVSIHFNKFFTVMVICLQVHVLSTIKLHLLNPCTGKQTLSYIHPVSCLFKLDRNVSLPLDMFVFAALFKSPICLETKRPYSFKFPRYLSRVHTCSNFISKL